MIVVKSRGDFRKTERFLSAMKNQEQFRQLSKYGQEGVNALALATPKDSGLTASSWSYKVEIKQGSAKITWENSNKHNGFPVAIMLQYGHGTGTGGYVKGQDYINPAIRPIFDKIADSVWKVVISS